MNRTQSLHLIALAFAPLTDIQIGFDTVGDKLFRMSLESERGHRRIRPSGADRPKASATVAARLFVVKYLADALAEPNKYTVADILRIRQERLYAQAFVAEYGDAIRAAWKAEGVGPADLRALDYCELAA